MTKTSSPPPAWFCAFGFDPLSAKWITESPEEKWYCVRLVKADRGGRMVYAFLSKAARDDWRQNPEDRPFTFRFKPVPSIALGVPPTLTHFTSSSAEGKGGHH